jgi:hypothetical protein
VPATATATAALGGEGDRGECEDDNESDDHWELAGDACNQRVNLLAAMDATPAPNVRFVADSSSLGRRAGTLN